eukprot:SAG22_NODE_7394_length_744_cov_0.787597_1_plen_135_part_00
MYLFNVVEDYHELHDQKLAQPARLAAMQKQLTEFMASIQYSQVNESGCGAAGTQPGARPVQPGPPSEACRWLNATQLGGGTRGVANATSKEECCGNCRATTWCKSAHYKGGECNLWSTFAPKPGSGVACVPIEP